MEDAIMLEIITPSGLFYLGNVGSATVRAREGDECYAFGHPLACKLFGEAELWIRGVSARQNIFFFLLILIIG